MQKYLLAPSIAVLFSVFAFAQGPLTVAPGITLTNGAIPYAADHFGGVLQVVPIHHSTVILNSHTGANIAGSLAGSFFYKPKQTTELQGKAARSIVHDLQPIFYIRLDNEKDPEGDSPGSAVASYAIVRAVIDKDRRVFARTRFTQLTGKATRDDQVIATNTEKLEGNWVRMTPVKPLEPGEYALSAIFREQKLYTTVVYDFSIAPDGPNVKDAITAGSLSSDKTVQQQP